MPQEVVRGAFPAAPQEFVYAGRSLYGRMLSFTDEEMRRSVKHVFPKRRGARKEDMNAAARRLEVELVFTGDQSGRDYGDLKTFLNDNPSGFLVHPVAGNWQAFCDGIRGQVRFADAVNQNYATLTFEETELDALSPRETPDVFAAAQEVTAQKTAYQQSVAEYFGAVALAGAEVGAAQDSIQAALSQVALVTAPVDLVLSAIAAAGAMSSAALGKLNDVAVRGQLLNDDVDAFVTAAQDLFAGTEVPAGAIQSVATLVGSVLVDGQAFEDALIGVSVMPAGAADAVDGVELLVASCLVLFDALRQQRPPVVVFTVPRLIDVVNLAKLLYPGDDPVKRSQELLSLNRIADPGAILGGTVLLRYAS